jgi:hypothetical protein
MDHSRDPCPWVILNDFGGAFAMGVCPLGRCISNPYTNTTLGCRRSSMAWCKGRKYLLADTRNCAYKPIVPQLTLRRATHRCHHSDQSPRARSRRQLRCLGRTFQHIRLRSQGHTEEGGPMERHHRRFLHWWIARSTRRLPVDAKRRDIMCYPAGCY